MPRLLARLLIAALACLAPTPGTRAGAQDDEALRAQFARYDAGESDDARRRLRDLCERRPLEALPWIQVAQFLVEREDFTAAEPFALEGRELNPGSPHGDRLLGTCLLFTEREGEAEKLFVGATRRFPDEPLLHYFLGLARGMNRKTLEAQRGFEAAVRLKGDEGLFLFAAGENLYFLNKQSEAESFFRKAATLKTPYPDATWRLAQMLGFKQRDEEAEEWFVRSLVTCKGRSWAPARRQYAIFLYERGRYDEAVALLERVTQQLPGDRMAWQYQARCLRRLGEEERAAAAVARYQQLQRREDEDTHRHILELWRRARDG